MSDHQVDGGKRPVILKLWGNMLPLTEWKDQCPGVGQNLNCSKVKDYKQCPLILELIHHARVDDIAGGKCFKEGVEESFGTGRK